MALTLFTTIFFYLFSISFSWKLVWLNAVPLSFQHKEKKLNWYQCKIKNDFTFHLTKGYIYSVRRQTSKSGFNSTSEKRKYAFIGHESGKRRIKYCDGNGFTIRRGIDFIKGKCFVFSCHFALVAIYRFIKEVYMFAWMYVNIQ